MSAGRRTHTNGGRVRRAHHAGSWYSADSKTLDDQLTGWLNAATVSHGPARAIISPHAGYSYCGATAAYAYKQIDPNLVDRVVVLGPSHHIHIPGCALTQAEIFETPIDNIKIDTQMVEKLYQTGKFSRIAIDDDEREHSLEMQMSYIAKVMKGRNYMLIPIVVGSINYSTEREYGRLLADYLSDPRNLFVISFRGEIWQFIEDLDRRGMKLIEGRNPEPFSKYLKDEGNTICGRHPIGVLLHALDALAEKNGHRFDLRFLDYSQSNHCKNMSDSSVSYAAASLTINASPPSSPSTTS